MPITGFTLHWYEAMLDNRVLLRALGNSVFIADDRRDPRHVIGTMAAFFLVRARMRYPNAARHPVHDADHGAGRPDRRRRC